MKKENRPVIALDVGGTKIRVAVVSPDGLILTRYQCLTEAEKGPEIVIERLIKAINITISKSKLNTNELAGICLAIAGSIDINNGLVNFSPHLPRWKDVHLQNIIGDKFGIKMRLINDASAAAIGEHRCGAGQGMANMVHLTIGTGIGGGIIIDNRLYLGTDGIAGEFGHTTIVADGLICSCGNRGCLEMYASGSAIEREAKRIIGTGRKSLILLMVDNDVNKINAKIVSQAALRQDIVAMSVISNAAYYLGVGLANIVNIFNPDMIVIGGGLSSLGERLLKPARKVIQERAFTQPAKTTKVIRSSLGDNAGLIGAAMYLSYS